MILPRRSAAQTTGAPRTTGWLAVAVLLGVMALLTLNWKHDSFWYDEALTAYVATDSWATLWDWVTAVDIQVPFHYLVLRLWAALAGDSEFALRAFSALCIPLAVAGMIAAGRRLAGRAAPGLAAGVLAGFLPGVLWIAYEVRAYALALALYAWATAFLFALLHAPPRLSRRLYLIGGGYALLMAATLYTHYTALGAFGAHLAIAGLAALDRLRRQRAGIRAVASVLAPVVIAGLLFAPWLPVALARGSTDRSFFPGSIPPAQSLEVMLGFKALARQDAPEIAAPFAAGYLLLAAGGLLIGAVSRRGRRAALYGLLLAVIPAALTVLILTVNPKLTGRYFWPAWPGLDLLAALGIAAVCRWRAAPAVLIALALAALPWLTGARGAPPESDYRAAFQTICTQGTPDDVILLRDGTLFVTARYYGARPPCEAPRHTIGMPEALITDVTRWLSLGETQAVMADIAAHRPPNVWVIAWQGETMDPQALTYALLDGAGDHTLQAHMYGDVRLDRYEGIDYDTLAVLARDGPLPAAEWFNLSPVPDGPRLIALRLFAPEMAQTGDMIVLHAWWERGETLQPDLRASARITTLDFGWTYTQIDAPPAGWFFWDDRWPPGMPIFSRYELTVGPDVPPGRVAVRYVVYDTQGRIEPLVIVAGNVTVAGR